jgi:hypothetical protein
MVIKQKEASVCTFCNLLSDIHTIVSSYHIPKLSHFCFLTFPSISIAWHDFIQTTWKYRLIFYVTWLHYSKSNIFYQLIITIGAHSLPSIWLLSLSVHNICIEAKSLKEEQHWNREIELYSCNICNWKENGNGGSNAYKNCSTILSHHLNSLGYCTYLHD